MGYNKYLGECSIFDVELWSILEGLAVIQDRRYVEVMIQIGCLEAIKTIKDSSLTSLNFALIRRIHHLLQNAGLWVIQHSPKDFNKIVDWLAKIAFDTNQDLKIFEEIPREVLALFFSVASDNLI
ncbi:hypothetical protein CXB51_024519 [Gossypium anomalum]|uniref:RNase H type-1 domain-containing protein n=1 Tax=Gossypium anomalum TaxID=47600 RepID=A0A8J6CQ65_9ROSI|nr:hypothetical protein CXB51_024519 [Gossypium anomalum]